MKSNPDFIYHDSIDSIINSLDINILLNIIKISSFSHVTPIMERDCISVISSALVACNIKHLLEFKVGEYRLDMIVFNEINYSERYIELTIIEYDGIYHANIKELDKNREVRVVDLLKIELSKKFDTIKINVIRINNGDENIVYAYMIPLLCNTGNDICRIMTKKYLYYKEIYSQK